MFKFEQDSKNRYTPRISPKLRPVKSDDDKEEKSKSLFWWVILLLGAGFLIFYLTSADKGSPTVINEDGEEVLSPERQAKLDRELEEIDNSVQYVLYATMDGYYPCYTCPNGATTIFLHKFEVWRYGTTRKGEGGRYPDGDLGAPNLLFVEEFEGTYSECLKMEKVKIYNYPLLPEAKARDFELFRPPGNKNDN